jgi:hypothetical protein
VDYRPSQPTGWSWTPGQPFSTTVGGHVTSVDFDFYGQPCRVNVLASGDPTDPYGVRYEDRPADPDIGYPKVLADTCGDHYTFRYLGGFPGCSELRVQSYSAFAFHDASYHFGANIYLVYVPDLAHGDPPADDATQWIQVVKHSDPMSSDLNVDNADRANPFYIYGGLTSINGGLVNNFVDCPQTGVLANGPSGGQPTLGTHLFQAESFLARDTGQVDRSGKGIVEIYGGVRWGWQAAQLT